MCGRLADSTFEVGIGIAALIGGVYKTRTARMDSSSSGPNFPEKSSHGAGSTGVDLGSTAPFGLVNSKPSGRQRANKDSVENFHFAFPGKA